MFSKSKNKKFDSELGVRSFTINSSFDLKELKKVQEDLSKDVMILDPPNQKIKSVTGIDLAYLNGQSIVVIVTFDCKDNKVIDKRVEIERTDFPYVPGFFGFREGAIIIRVLHRLSLDSDLLMINAHGIAHPERFGCASHIGVLMRRPTIGVASRVLCGSYKVKPSKVGEWVLLRHSNQIVGAVLKSKEGCRPIVISPGHLITLEKSISIVKKFLRGKKFPEPLYMAHKMANQVKRSMKDYEA